MQIYVVKTGDTVYGIASVYGVTAESIIETNQIAYPYRLAVGQALLIPVGVREPERGILSGGYAYPFIRPELLAETLPYLSRLLVFSYGFTEEGQLLAPELPDAWMIQAAEEAGAEAFLTLTPFGADGNFNNQLIHRMLTQSEARKRLISELLWTAKQKGFHGVDVDFEFILAEDRVIFADFVRDLRERMAEQGYQVSVALAPKTSAGQRGALYEGKDYRLLGAAADQALLMTYEWGYTYGPPMAVAPIPQVRRVVSYAVSEIPPGKLLLGIPNYGYDWPLPYVRGTTEARTIGNEEAIQIALAAGAEISFDETAKAPYFYYKEEGISHVVWFEDVRSIQAKFELLREFDLAGACYWQLMRPFRANWRLLADEFWVEK